MGVSSGVEFSPEVIAAALKSIYRSEFDIDHELETHLYAATAEIFREAAAQGVAAAVEGGAPLPDGAFREALMHSADVFAAFRTHRMQNDIAARLTDGGGKLKSFAQFARDVQPYISHRNRAWLRTEYDTAVRRAQLASDWRRFEAERDVLPNLRWKESVSPHPGADHKVFWGTVRPIDDPFWTRHRPGDRWNCKCSLEATDDPPTAVPDSSPADNPAPGLENNPGKDGAIFSDRHPYFPGGCSVCPFAKNRLRALLADLADRKDCMECAKVDEAARRAELINLNVRDNKEKFREAQAEIRSEMLQAEPVRIDNKRLYSKHLYFGKNEIKSVIAHCFNGLELEAALQLPALLPELKNGRYEHINMRRRNYRQKIRGGVRNFVVYDVKIGNDVFELKCEAVIHDGTMKEHPYSFKIERK